MPRAEVGTPKWLANKMKAKGLQRLRWYCQMCEKQCRDENGFKCHINSEAHQRQMKIFVQRPGKFMDDFSRQFELSFMQLMRTKYCRTRVLANSVYCEVIADKQHIHMNATVWVTLTEFVLYLARSGKCKVDQTPRGWYVEYIDTEKLQREKELRKGLLVGVEGEYLEQLAIKEAIKKEQERVGEQHMDEDTVMHTERSQPVLLKLPKPDEPMGTTPPTTVPQPSAKSLFDSSGRVSKSGLEPAASSTTPQLQTLDKIIIDHEKYKRKRGMVAGEVPEDLKSQLTTSDRKRHRKWSDDEEEVETVFPDHPLRESDVWVSEDLIVEVSNETVGNGIFLHKKGEIVKVLADGVTSHVRMFALPNEKKRRTLKLDDSFLYSVIPKPPNGWARIVLGRWRGHEGRVLRCVQPDSSSGGVDIMLFVGPYWGDVPEDLESNSLIDRDVIDEYIEHLKIQRDKEKFFERGELLVSDLPFDCVCRVNEPDAYAQETH